MTKDEALKLALDLLRKKEWEACDYVANANEAADILEKALAQPQQEPVAWELGAEVYWGDSPELSDYVRKEGTPLYTTPPQRNPWVSLTDEQIDDAIDAWFGCEGKTWRVRMRAAIKAAHGIKE